MDRIIRNSWLWLLFPARYKYWNKSMVLFFIFMLYWSKAAFFSIFFRCKLERYIRLCFLKMWFIICHAKLWEILITDISPVHIMLYIYATKSDYVNYNLWYKETPSSMINTFLIRWVTPYDEEVRVITGNIFLQRMMRYS